MSGEPTPPDDSSGLSTSSESPHESPAVANSTSEPARDPTLPSEAEQSPPIPALDSPPSTVPPPEGGGDEASRAAPPDASPGVPNAPPQPASGEVASPTEVEKSLPVPAADSSVQSSSSAPPPAGPDALHSPLPSAMQEHPSRPASAQASRKSTLNVGGPSATAKAATVCPKCRGGGRNLVVCIDGTSNQFSQKNTNVVELYSRLVKSNGDQLTFYNSGIGTYASPSWHSLGYYLQVIANKLDLAFALRFERIILSAYAWLADNYVEGDRIFLFGFSRGAYQVRALSAMIDRVGLIHKGNDDQIPFAYELYAAPHDKMHAAVADELSPQGALKKTLEMVYVVFLPILAFLLWLWNRCRTSEVITAITDSDASMSEIDAQSESDHDDSSQDSDDLKESASTMQTRFRKAFARRVRVHFVGAWDTVSSVGLMRGRALPGTAEGMSHVCHFRHALALHERRVKFLPEFVRGGLGPAPVKHRDNRAFDEKPSNVLSAEVIPSEPDPLLASSTTGVTESNHDDERAGNARAIPSSPPVQQVAQDAASVPPHTKEVWFPGSHSDIGGGASPNVHMRQFGPSLRWMSFEARVAGLRLTKEPRHWRKKLPRTNSLSLFWKLIEFLPVKRLTYDSDTGTTHRPHLWARRPFHPGQLFYDAVSPEAEKILLHAGLEKERDPYLASEQLLKRLKDCLRNKTLLSEEDRFVIQNLRDGSFGQQQLLVLDRNDDPDENISQYLTAMLCICDGRSDDAHSIELANDIQLLLYGLQYSFDVMRNSRPLHEVLGISLAGGLRMYPKPLRRHQGPIMTLGCLKDARRIVSGSWDGTINVWDAFTGQQIGEPIRAAIGCGAVVPDGKVLIGEFGPFYGSGAVKVWDLEAGAKIITCFEPGIGDVYGNSSVAYSLDCKRIAYACEAGVIVRDASTGRLIRSSYPVDESIWVPTMSFSSDSHYLAAGFSDGRIAILPLDDAGVATDLLIAGHDQAVRAVAYSPNKLLVSGSEDGSVRVWSADTGEVLHVMTGHSSGVLCVAFSPTGKYIASGSRDHSVRIWNSETGRPVGVPLKGHTDVVRCVTFTPDGTRVISGSNDHTIRIWDRMPTIPLDGREDARNPSYPAAALPVQVQPQPSASDPGPSVGPEMESIPPSDGSAPNPPSGADPNLPTAAGDAPQPADASSPPVADQPAQSGGAAGAAPEPEPESCATVGKVPGSEEPHTHGDGPPRTAHVEAAGDATDGEGKVTAHGEAEAGDAIAPGKTVAPLSPEDAREPVPLSDGAAPNAAHPTLLTAAGDEPQLAEDQQTAPPIADAAHAPEPVQEPHATAGEVPGSEGPLAGGHGEGRPPTAHIEAAGAGEAEAGLDAATASVTETVEHTLEDDKV